jgi:hypothetical protein
MPYATAATAGSRRAAELGMRRVLWVRVLHEGDRNVCEAFGVGHRFPAVRRVSLGTALALADQGVPIVVRDRPSPTVPVAD